MSTKAPDEYGMRVGRRVRDSILRHLNPPRSDKFDEFYLATLVATVVPPEPEILPAPTGPGWWWAHRWLDKQWVAVEVTWAANADIMLVMPGAMRHYDRWSGPLLPPVVATPAGDEEQQRG